jgi:hypothetical protein
MPRNRIRLKRRTGRKYRNMNHPFTTVEEINFMCFFWDIRQNENDGRNQTGNAAHKGQ